MATFVLAGEFLAFGTYTATLRDHSPTPVVSQSNAPGQGRSLDGCISFNPSFIPASSTFNESGLLLRLCCGAHCVGHGQAAGVVHDSSDPISAERAGVVHNSSDPISAERIGFAPCDVETGRCGDVVAGFNLDPASDAEDPRAFLYEGTYYNFYYRGTSDDKNCTGDQCTVKLAKTSTPLVAASWQAIVTLPWHRNGCCAMKPRGQRSYCIWGEGPGPFPGLGISYTTDIDSGVFVQDEWRVAGGVESPLWLRVVTHRYVTLNNVTRR